MQSSTILPVTVRPARPGDQANALAAIATSGLFPPNELDDLNQMLTAYFADDAGVDRWLVADEGDQLTGVAYYAPERMTDGTWNVYLIAVRRDRQGRGHGTALMHHIEQTLTEQAQRVLLVETSGLPEFALTRAFYHKIGYDEEARIREFYRAGEDKIVFRKALSTPPVPAHTNLPD